MRTKEIFWNDYFQLAVDGTGWIQVEYTRDPDWFEFITYEYDEVSGEMEEVSTFVIPAQLMPLMLRVIAIMLRTEGHAQENISYLASHRLEKYEYDPGFLQRTEQEKQGGF